MKTIRQAAEIIDLDMALVAADLALSNSGAAPGDYSNPIAQAELSDLSPPQRVELGTRILKRYNHGQQQTAADDRSSDRPDGSVSPATPMPMGKS